MWQPRRDSELEFHKLVRNSVRSVVFQFHHQTIIAGPAGTGKYTIVRMELELHEQPINVSRPYINGRSIENEMDAMQRVVDSGEILVVDIEDEDRIPDAVFVKLESIVKSGAPVVIIREEDLANGHPRVTTKELLMNPIWRHIDPHYVSYYEIDRAMRLTAQA